MTTTTEEVEEEEVLAVPSVKESVQTSGTTMTHTRSESRAED